MFAHDNIREGQKELYEDIVTCLNQKKSLIAHAPTGLGKTAASLSPALEYSLLNNKKVFFLTSRHTQHEIAINTLLKLQDKTSPFTVTDIIGKKFLCLVSGTEMLSSSEFSNFCKKHRETDSCEFYNNSRKGNKPSIELKQAVLESKNIMGTNKIIDIARKYGICPYELTLERAKKSSVFIADYNYIFIPKIRSNFFARTGINLNDCILIIDEGHNLPERIRESMSAKLTSFMLSRAKKEAVKYGYFEIIEELERYETQFINLKNELGFNEEMFIKKESLNHSPSIIKRFDEIGDEIRKNQKSSVIGNIASFLDLWSLDNNTFIRLFDKTTVKSGVNFTVSFKSLDPGFFTKDIINNTHSTILMSGTLNPTVMYEEILGFKNTIKKSYKSPFLEDNKLNLIVPKTSTKFNLRNDMMFKQIAKECSNFTDLVPGNTIIFFPSYSLRDKIYPYFKGSKTIFAESNSMMKSEKKELIERFKEYSKIGAVLLAVVGGSFYEGIDLPGELLKAVVVVGLPLQKPSLEVKSLIEYYDKKFKKGWDYGYLFPAMNKCFQSAGRCIRTETDRGVIMFLDQRYSWNNYFRTFPLDWNIKIKLDYNNLVKSFYFRD